MQPYVSNDYSLILIDILSQVLQTKFLKVGQLFSNHVQVSGGQPRKLVKTCSNLHHIFVSCL